MCAQPEKLPRAPFPGTGVPAGRIPVGSPERGLKEGLGLGHGPGFCEGIMHGTGIVGAGGMYRDARGEEGGINASLEGLAG